MFSDLYGESFCHERSSLQVPSEQTMWWFETREIIFRVTFVWQFYDTYLRLHNNPLRYIDTYIYWWFLHFFHERLTISDNIWISHNFEKMNFHQSLLDLFLIHFRNINNFHDVLLFILFIFDEHCIAETSFSDNVNLSIFLHFEDSKLLNR